jgi:hypothetical protein
MRFDFWLRYGRAIARHFLSIRDWIELQRVKEIRIV